MSEHALPQLFLNQQSTLGQLAVAAHTRTSLHVKPSGPIAQALHLMLPGLSSFVLGSTALMLLLSTVLPGFQCFLSRQHSLGVSAEQCPSSIPAFLCRKSTVLMLLLSNALPPPSVSLEEQRTLFMLLLCFSSASPMLLLLSNIMLLLLLQAFSLHSSMSSPGLLHHSSDPSGMATPQLLEHASSGGSQLQHSVDAPHQVHPTIFHPPP